MLKNSSGDDFGTLRLGSLRWLRIARKILHKYEGPRSCYWMSNITLKVRLISFKWAKIARIILLKHLEH